MKKNKYDIIEPYIYIGSVSLTASSSGVITKQVTGNYDFYWTSFSYKATVNSSGFIPAFSVQVQSNEQNIFEDYVPNELFAGIMTELSTSPDTRYPVGLANPYKLPVPYLFVAKSTIKVNLRNDIAASNTVQFALIGWKGRIKVQ